MLGMPHIIKVFIPPCGCGLLICTQHACPVVIYHATGEIVMKERKRGRSPDPTVAVKRKKSSQEAALAKFLLLCETGETAGKSPSRQCCCWI